MRTTQRDDVGEGCGCTFPAVAALIYLTAFIINRLLGV